LVDTPGGKSHPDLGRNPGRPVLGTPRPPGQLLHMGDGRCDRCHCPAAAPIQHAQQTVRICPGNRWSHSCILPLYTDIDRQPAFFAGGQGDSDRPSRARRCCGTGGPYECFRVHSVTSGHRRATRSTSAGPQRVGRSTEYAPATDQELDCLPKRPRKSLLPVVIK